MNRQATVAILAVFLFGLVASARQAPAEKTASAPSAERVLDDFVKASGGRAAYLKHSTLVIKAAVEVVGLGLEGTLESYASAPNLFATTVVLGGYGTIRNVFDGQKGWESSGLAGVRELEGSELAVLRRQAIFNADADWRDLWKVPTGVEVRELGSRRVYVVQLQPKDGQGGAMTNYYDAETALLVRSDAVLETEAATIPVVTTYADYRAVDGVKLPFSTEQEIPTGRIRVTASSVTFNAKIDQAVFSKPLAP